MSEYLSKPKQIAHIGIAVRSINNVLPFYTQILGLQVTRRELLERELVSIAFLPIGESYLELMEPLSQKSTIFQFIERYGEGVHHVALGVNQLSNRIQKCKQHHIPLVDDYPRKGAWDNYVAFIHPKAANGVLFELCERRTTTKGYV
ncbi:methylmalonyl-CoA epimerase [Virgibacillus dokdonensis]|uniref:methylmalonyl-CoA epimerase n=1 Tax=Virgibacillus dokdonensis TaxID=302167 RepID=UPI000989AF14|nr:methylmalonyl-CoA epimerase [Virgibacillus dokdonensis]